MEDLLECGMDIGERMLICGGDVHRVEDSLSRIFKALGASRIDVFIITTSMVVTVHTNDGKSFTQTRRINETETDFEQLHQLNQLSRQICTQKLSAAEIRTELQKIACAKKYPFWLDWICYAVISGVFTLFFGGNIIEAVSALCIGIIVRLLVILCSKAIGNRIFSKFISSLAATSLAYAVFYLGIIPDPHKVIIGGIMALLPGLGLTTAIRDLFTGDSMSGLLRTIEACLTALAIAAGYFVFAMISGGVSL